jgi:hypothetical protein
VKSRNKRRGLGEVAVDTVARETPNIFAMSVAAMLFSRSWRALAASASATLRGRPNLVPFVREVVRF